MAKPDGYWLLRLRRDEQLARRSAGQVAEEVRRSYRSQYLQVARRLDELYAEAQARGELSRTKLWNYVSYRQLERELSAFCEAGSVIQRDALTKCLDDVFRRTMGRRVEEMDRGRFILPYSPRAVIDTAWSGDQFSDRIWRNTGELAERIRAAATQVVNGLRSTPAIKRELMRDFDVSASNAERLIDTEVAYVFNKANLMGFRERGVRRLTITNLDVNTCEKCKALEDEVFRAEDVPVLPIHPRCRCAYCVPAGGDGEEVTASGGDLDSVYARKGVKGYGDGAGAAGATGATGAKLYSPRAQRAAEVARENGLIPARELQAKAEQAMKASAPELAGKAEKPAEAKAEAAREAAQSAAPAAPAQLSELTSENPEKPDEIAPLRLPERAESGIIQLGINGRFVNSKEKLFRYAASVKEIPGFQDFVSHGSPNEFLIYMDADGEGMPDGEEVSYTPRQFADMIRASSSYHGGDVRLIACQVGRDDDGAAQQVARLLGVRVMAPTENVHMNSKGEIFLSDSDELADMWRQGLRVKESGRWRIFEP